MGLSNLTYVNSIFWSIIRNTRNWPEFFWKHFLKSKGKMMVNMRNGYKMRVNPYHSEMTIVTEIWNLKIYNPKGFEIKKDDTIVDIGGHIGSFSIYAATQATEGRIFAFEPLKDNYDEFKKNIALNKIKNIILENKAVASKSGTRTFYAYDDDNSGSSSLYAINKGKKIHVKTVKLSEVIKKHGIKKINLMKLDCEGAEYEILFTLPDKILKSIDKIAMEYHDIPEHKHAELISFLKKHHFSVIKSSFSSLIYAKREK